MQTVRRKCNAYHKEGLLNKEKNGKTVVFSLDSSPVLWLKSNKNILDALSFYQMAGSFGMTANYLLEHLDTENRTFRVKHSFFVHTLEDEVLFANYEKNTTRIDENTYECLIYYNQGMETELLIEVMSFGPMITVVGNDRFLNSLKKRLENQMNYHKL